MKEFLAFVRKEFYHIFRDKRTMLILLAMPVVQIILFGFAITTEVQNVQVGVCNPTPDASTDRIIERLDASEYFNVAYSIHTPHEINELFQRGKVNLVLVFEENFQENLYRTGSGSIQLIADATDPNQAVTLTGYASSIIASWQQELIEQQQIPFQINPEVHMLYNPRIKSAYNFVPGVMGLILMLICAMMTSISIVREKETGTMEVLLASPLRPIFIILAKAVPYFTLSVVNLISILLLSVFLLNVPIAGSLFWLTILSFLFIGVALAFGLLISTLVDNQVAAILISGMGLMLPVMALSGLIFPIESMPPLLQWISTIIPARWYIAAVRKLMIEGVDVHYVIREIIILSGMAFVMITISLKKFRIRLN